MEEQSGMARLLGITDEELNAPLGWEEEQKRKEVVDDGIDMDTLFDDIDL